VSEFELLSIRKNSAAARPRTAAGKPTRSRRKIETLSDTEAKEQCRRQAAEIKALERKLEKRDLTVAKLRAEASELKKAPTKLQAKLDAVCDTVEWRAGQLLKGTGSAHHASVARRVALGRHVADPQHSVAQDPDDGGEHEEGEHEALPIPGRSDAAGEPSNQMRGFGGGHSVSAGAKQHREG
jgi:uncharacterized protein YhaN